MKNILFIVLGSILLFVAATTKSNANTNALVRPCILVNAINPTAGNPDYYYKCTTTFVQLSVKNCGTAGNSVDPNLFTYSWVNTTSGSFTYTSPTVNTSEMGRWVVTISYTDISSGITYNDKDTLDLFNYTDIPIAINNSNAAYAHCPYEILNFTATSNSNIISNSYKWYINPTNTKDTNVAISSSGAATWSTVIPTIKYVVVSATDINGCKTLDNIFAPLLPTPIAPNIGATKIKCPGKNITLTAAFQTNNTYSWDGGPFTSTNTFTTSVPGKHWVTVQRGLGCKVADTTFISEYTLPSINIGNDTSLCYLESGQLSAAVSGTPSYTYSWSPASYFNNAAIGNPIISITPITTVNITLTVTDGNTCTNTASKNVTHLAQGSNPYLNPSAADLIICDGTTKFFDTNVSATYATTYTYAWTPTTFLSDPTIKKPIVDLNGTGTSNITYSLKVTDFKGCYTIITPSATLVPAVTTNVGFADSSVCINGIITLLSSATGGTPALTYSWTPTTGLTNPNSANTSLSVSQNQLYTITVSDTKGCSDTKTVDIKSVNVKISLTATDTTGYNTEALILTPDVNSATYTYIWINNTAGDITVGTGKSLGVTTSGEYTITGKDPISQCYATDKINVIIREGNPRAVYIPNVLNPNSSNDENNRVKVYGIAVLEDDFAFRIYNKWGQLIYETNSFTDANKKGWTGAYKGDGVEQNQSVYTYSLHGHFFDGEEFNKTGSITLMK